MRARRIARLALLLTAVACTAAFAATNAKTRAATQRSDGAREDRWAAQVAPDVVVGDVVWLSTPSRPRVLAIYAGPAASSARAAVIVVHGMGVNPDWGVVGVLRSALPDDGFATLSVQMPVLAADASRGAYSALFPKAGERLGAAYAWLAARGYDRIAVVSHSLGAAMTDAWLARADAAPIVAWVPIGMPVPFSRPPREPVLDVVAEHDLADVVASAPARAAELAGARCSREVRVPDADHYFERGGKALAARIAAFLDEVLGGECRR
jgi:alpha/beta superfamily hydrolase